MSLPPISLSLFLTRYREVSLLALGASVGIVSGIVVAMMGWLTDGLHSILFGLPMAARLSEQRALAHWWLAFVPAIGGALIGASLWMTRQAKARLPVDPIEANALHGGRMRLGESLVVAAQTVVSSGFGASVGLEAGYTQAAASLASRLAIWLDLRRAEVRMLVGCGAAGAISAAFDAPLAGAFYAFELIIGTYSVMIVGPVIAAALAADVVVHGLPLPKVILDFGQLQPVSASALPAYIVLGCIGGLAAVAVMRLVAIIEAAFVSSRCPTHYRPVVAGLIVGIYGFISPQVLSSGHGAIRLELALTLALGPLIFLFCLKTLASAISLGAGFRGGLFFSSLFLGTLLGKIFAACLGALHLGSTITPMAAAVVGMAAMAVGAVGGPLTMTFLTLEATNEFTLAAAVLVASVASAVVVRQTFGYSFATWRLHLRGETIRSAHDVGRMRSLTVGSMMRSDFKTVPVTTTIDAFRSMFPLGSGHRVVALDAEGRYAGIVIMAEAHAANDQDAADSLKSIVKYVDVMLTGEMNAEEAAERFQAANSEELAVVDNPATRRVLGIVTEQHLLRRYTDELSSAGRDLAGIDTVR